MSSLGPLLRLLTQELRWPRLITCKALTYSISSEDRPNFPGSKSEYTSKLKLIDPDDMQGIPVYRVLNQEGHVVDASQEPKLDESTVLKMYRDMTLLFAMDTFMFRAQHQGRLSFYITSHGEEGTHIGSAAALYSQDLIFGQYREAGVLIWRGFPVEQFIHQCIGTKKDFAKGRSNPLMYGSKELSFVTISATLATQIPQAAGAAYAFKRKHNGLCVMCYFGDGAASEGDAHAGFNFASVLNCPVIFFCRNNGYAISTKTKEQYRGDGIASRAAGYGMPCIRVDGNDIFAVYNATKLARDTCLKQSRPVLIEAMTYRVGSHSTSDDSLAYRSADEANYWNHENNPITRLKQYMVGKGWWNDGKEKQLLQDSEKMVMSALSEVEKTKKAKIETLFEDVYKEMPPHIEKQMEELKKNLKQNKEHYPLDRLEGFE